jgi:hypothetical protein
VEEKIRVLVAQPGVFGERRLAPQIIQWDRTPDMIFKAVFAFV